MKTLSEIKEKAITITEPIKVMSGSINGKEITYTPEIEEYNGYYTTNNGILSFIENNVQYVIPNTYCIERIVIEAGFKETANIYVPFKHGGFPIDEAEKWSNLMLHTID